MDQRVSMIMIGARDVPKLRAFYERGLGWKPWGPTSDVSAMYEVGHSVLVFLNEGYLAKERGVAIGEGSKISLAVFVESKEEVDRIFALALVSMRKARSRCPLGGDAVRRLELEEDTMWALRFALAAAWLVVAWVSVGAVSQMGLGAAGATFIGDFAHPWRAQFNADFSAHLLLMAAWVVYRETNRFVGLLLGAAAILFGGVFSLAYIFVATFRCPEDFRKLLLGGRASSLH